MAVFVWTAAVAGNWSLGANWSVGGVAQAAPPTAADDAQFGFGTGATNTNCTIQTAAVARSVIVDPAYTATIIENTTNSLSIGDGSGGELRLHAGMTLTTAINFSILFVATSDNAGAGWNITTAGKQLVGTGGSGLIQFTGNGGRWKLIDDWISTTGILTSNTNTIDFNSKSVTTVKFLPGNTTSFIWGTATITVTSTAAITIFQLPSTGTCTGTLNLVISVASANNRAVVLQGKTINSLTQTVAGSTGSLNVTPAGGTITTITFSDASNARSFRIAASDTLHYTTWTGSGTSGKLITINSLTGATRATLFKDSGAPTSADFLSVTDIDAEGVIPFYAGANSTDGGNNRNVVFTANPGLPPDRPGRGSPHTAMWNNPRLRSRQPRNDRDRNPAITQPIHRQSLDYPLAA